VAVSVKTVVKLKKKMKKAQDGVTEAIKKQKEKRAAMYARADAKKESEISKRRAKGLPTSKKTQVTKAPAKGSDVTKYMKKEDPIKKNVQRNTQIKSANEYYDKLAGNKKKTAPVKKPIDRSSIAAPIKASTSRAMPSMSKPSTPGVSNKPQGRKYSDKETKMIPLAEKVKKGENVAASQMKLKALQDKRRAEKMRAERKENRTAKKSNRTEKRSAVKAVKKSYKK
jgi:hypothetical protein